MCGKTIKTDENMLENFQYPQGEPPVLRLTHVLDDFKNGEIACHWHSEFAFSLLLKGKLDYYIVRNAGSKIHCVLNPGDGVFINSRVLHGCRQIVPGTVLFTFVTSPSFFANPIFGSLYRKIILPVMNSRKYGLFFLDGKKEDTGILELYREFQALGSDDLDYELRTMELICRIWENLAQRLENQNNLLSCPGIDSSQVHRIRSMLDFIQHHYMEQITVEEIARAGGVSRRECFRCFRATIDQTPIEYLIQYRLSVAAFLLTTSDQTLTEICEACGFENMSYFTKCFKQKYGMLPRQFRY